MEEQKIELGDTVLDPITGFEGVVVSEHRYLHGCIRVNLQSPIDKIPDQYTFDVSQLVIISKRTHTIGDTRWGGPEKSSDIRVGVPGPKQ